VLGSGPQRRLPGASRSFNLGSRRDGSGSRGSTASPARHNLSSHGQLPEWLASALPGGGGQGGGRRLRKRVVPGALPEPGTPTLYEYPGGWPSSLDSRLLYHSEAQVPPMLQALRCESSTRDRGFTARQLLTRSKGERRRRG
jgi:hypothetical protein